jgi:hypothetical protein
VTAPLQDRIGSHVVTQREIALCFEKSNCCSERSLRVVRVSSCITSAKRLEIFYKISLRVTGKS